MASRRNTRDGRDLTNSIAKAPTYKIKPSTLHRLEPIRSLEDRRLYHPLKQHRPAAARVVKARQIIPQKSWTQKLPQNLKFRLPEQVSICARRKIRKQVLHALRKTRKGGGAGKRNWFSTISCR